MKVYFLFYPPGGDQGVLKGSVKKEEAESKTFTGMSFRSISLMFFCQWRSSYRTNANSNWSDKEATNPSKLGIIPKMLNSRKSTIS